MRAPSPDALAPACQAAVAPHEHSYYVFARCSHWRLGTGSGKLCYVHSVLSGTLGDPDPSPAASLHRGSSIKKPPVVPSGHDRPSATTRARISGPLLAIGITDARVDAALTGVRFLALCVGAGRIVCAALGAIAIEIVSEYARLEVRL